MMRRARILFVSRALGRGGAERVVLNLLRYLDRAFFEHHVAALSAERQYMLSTAPHGSRRFIAQVLMSSVLLTLVLDAAWVSSADKTFWIVFALIIAKTAELEETSAERAASWR